VPKCVSVEGRELCVCRCSLSNDFGFSNVELTTAA